MSGAGHEHREATTQGGQVSAWALFGIVYATSISSVYFALGVVARHADGLTPEVFILAAVFFQLTAMTYAEGLSLHPGERGGAAAFARYAFNELVSFIAGWAIVLDYAILVAVAAVSAPAYLGVFWPWLGHGTGQLIAGLTIVALVVTDGVVGVSARRLRRRVLIAGADLILQVVVIVLGVVLVFHPSHLSQAVHFGTAPSASDLAFALPVGVIAFAGIESAAGLVSESLVNRRELKRLLGPGTLAIAIVYVGISIVGVAALPVHHGITALGQHDIDAPVLKIVEGFHPHGVADVLKYLVGIGGAVGLIAAAGASMIGVSRTGYALATNRQIPSAVGRLSGRWGTPWVVIVAAGLAAAALVVPHDVGLLVGIYAFGALTTFSIAHLSVLVMRFRDPQRERPYKVPFGIPIRGASVPLPAIIGALLSLGGWVSLLIFHHGARYVGVGWLLLGVTFYTIYRKSQGKPITRRITIHERALRHETSEPDFASILVPITGSMLDDDIVQTAGQLAGENEDDLDHKGATIEAIWIFEIPMSLPLDAPLPAAQTQLARQALLRAKEVGEEYEGVEVATAMVRARRAGQAIVNEARRRGVEVIVLAADAADEKGVVGRSRKFGGEVKYVLEKAPCRVILTAPAIDSDASAHV